jgi:dihydroxyacetone kinase-like protein
MKKLLDDPAEVVADSLRGLASAHADLLSVHHDPTFVQRRGGTPPGRVGVVAGGGSGHEPLPVGLVGDGMLDVAVPGAVFTAPTSDQMAAALQAADSGAGVLALVLNYTADVLHVETAVEVVQDAGVEVATVLVDDDVAVENSVYTAGRRGVAGAVFAAKVAGAAAARGDSLAEVAATAEHAVAHVRTMGVALSASTVPQVGRPGFDLPDGEAEFGIGLHGEPGRYRLPASGASAVARRLVDAVLEDLAPPAGGRVLLFVNGMGGTPSSELYITYARARDVVEERGLEVVRSLVGTYATSLEMQGVSVSVALLDDELTRLWDAPVRTAALTW